MSLRPAGKHPPEAQRPSGRPSSRWSSRWSGLVERARYELPREYEIGGVRLRLPARHPLPAYQAAHPRYDRFLPHLAAQLAPGSAGVDVGANVGDTLAALLAGQPGLDLLAVEPDAGFWTLLQANAKRLAAAHPQARLTLRQALVGRAGQSLMLVPHQPGTRQAVAATTLGVAGQGDALPTQPLAELVAGLGSAFHDRLRLVKCDVDGWDHDVLASALPLLCQRQPMVFAECMPRGAADHDAYLELVQELFANGYVHLQLFDNTGNPLAAGDSPTLLAQALGRLLEKQPGGPPYLDLLLTTAADRPLAERALRAFEQAHPR